MNAKSYFLDVFRSHEKEIHGLNGIRAIAFFMLMYVHIYRPFQFFGFHDENPFLANFMNNGSMCMDAFFMLSGFLIGGQLFAELVKTNTLDFKNFFLKRVFRIFPPYYIFLILQYLILVGISRSTTDPLILENIHPILDRIHWDFLYMTDYFAGTMIHGWSLSVEEKFYILLPILLVSLKWIPSPRGRLTVIFLLSAIPVAVRYFTYQFYLEGNLDSTSYNKFFYYPFHSRMDSLFWGVFIAGLHQYYPRIIQNFLSSVVSRLTVFLAITSLMAISLFTNEEDYSAFTAVWKFWILAILWSVLLLKCLDTQSWTSRFLSLRIFTPVAKLSYCAYIIHLVFLGVLTNKFIGYGKIYHHEIMIWFIPIGIMILGISYFYYLLTERPFLLLRKKVLS